MIGLDTNVIVRYVMQDDPAQATAATRIIDSLSAENPGFVSLVVVAELAWVLDFSYRIKQEGIERAVQTLLESEEIIVEQAETVAQALRLFRAGGANFADFLIERSGNAAGCQHTFTFDQKAARSAGMRLLK